MKLGSLFDGSGGFPLAGSLCGMTPVFAAEIEPYPIAVTTNRFPNMRHLGDISKINGTEIEPVHTLTFGSPCQDLSIAGKQAGLKHEANGDEETTRSGLFMEAVRIIKEMREATHGVYPRFAVWENVPGAFSSNKGEDFRIVLEELIKIVEPTAVMPPVPKAGWSYADHYCGDGWSLAYRVLDAQYWGVPQRRRRIYLVLDFGGQSAGKVLFERKSLRGYFETGRTPWQGAAGDAEGSVETADRERNSVAFTQNQRDEVRILGDKTGALQAQPGMKQQSYIVDKHILDDQGGSRITIRTDGKSPTLRAEMHGNMPCVMESAGFCKEHSAQARGIGFQEEVAPTLRAGAIPACVYSIENHPNDSRVNIDTSGKVQTLTSRMGTGGGNNQPVICLQGNGIDRSDTAGCNGKGWTEDVCYTLNTIDRPAVAYATDVGFFNSLEEISPTLLARDYKDPHMITEIRYIVRRLTPTECARLQGFPDRWGAIPQKNNLTDDEYSFWLEVRNTHEAINGRAAKEYTRAQMLTWYNKLHTDSSEYKMWGNGIALPNALYVMQGIAEVITDEV